MIWLGILAAIIAYGITAFIDDTRENRKALKRIEKDIEEIKKIPPHN